MPGSPSIGRLALIPLGIVLGLVVLEAGLHLAGWMVQKRTGAQLPSSWLTGTVRILCLGDSNTYGLRVAPEKTYPKQLEALWNETVEAPKVEVLNLGFPGTNSSRLVRDVPRLLEILSPDITIIMVGVNDFWTLPFSLESSAKEPGGRSLLERHSLLYRLYYLIRRGRQGREIEVILDPDGSIQKGARHTARVGDQEFQMGFSRAHDGLAGDREALIENLLALVARAEAGDTLLYLMSYPARHMAFYRMANQAIRKVAHQTNTPLIDLTRVFTPLCPELECPKFLLKDDHHPNGRGYSVVAKTILAQLSD